MLPQSTATVKAPVLVSPPRFTVAGICIWCERRECASARCIELHATSVWAVCQECDGKMWLDDDTRCCTLGITQLDARHAVPTVAEAVPVSVPPAMLTVALPRCLGCGHRTATPHLACYGAMNHSGWWPCDICCGLRIDSDGMECRECCGAGFIPERGDKTLAEMAGDVTPW
ncbi:hypothetical protein [Catelliglobosispora koreensis]|uniref:hypothetical protein n=1 Tax=Catelliglobosispora koreensis TaxID=129052 RepID=UPI0003800790|nr:hypothetical protein [Catelliglobosispora koreensis]